MISLIRHFLNAGFERDLFEAIIEGSKDIENPLRINTFSYAMRELSRHILKRYAPDDNVLGCSWYKNETDKENGITRKQRAIYAVQGGLDDCYLKNILKLETDEIHRQLIKSITELNKYTHIESQYFNISKDDANYFIDKTFKAFHDFLKLIYDCKIKITNAVWEAIDNTIIEKVLSETIQSLDELATHHFIEEVYLDVATIDSINHEFIEFDAQGIISCELQWGSNSDLRNDNGMLLNKTFNFTCKLYSKVTTPDEVRVYDDSLGIDTKKMLHDKYGLDERKKEFKCQDLR